MRCDSECGEAVAIVGGNDREAPSINEWREGWSEL